MCMLFHFLIVKIKNFCYQQVVTEHLLYTTARGSTANAMSIERDIVILLRSLQSTEEIKMNQIHTWHAHTRMQL